MGKSLIRILFCLLNLIIENSQLRITTEDGIKRYRKSQRRVFGSFYEKKNQEIKLYLTSTKKTLC